MAGERQTEPHQAVDWHKRAEWIDIREENERLEAEVARLRAERDRERSARHAAERVNAEAVVARRTNLEAQVESERVRAEAAEARVAELEAERDRAQIEVERLGKVLEQNEEWREGYAYGVSAAAAEDRVDRAVTEQRDEMLMWLRREDPSALKGYWPALHALEAEFSAPTRTQEDWDKQPPCPRCKSTSVNCPLKGPGCPYDNPAGG